MKQSQLFTKTLKDAPKDEVSLNAQLLIRAGYIYKEMAGVYSFLPLGLRVLNKIEGIIREEMDAIGGVEMRTSVFQNKEVWEKSGRWDDTVVDNWFKTKLKNGTEVGLSFTNEEAYSNLLKQYINSYKDLPVYPYDFKTIFRNEVRSKSGIFRGREFYWKALYSFSKDEKEHDEFYEKSKGAYLKIFSRCGLEDITYLTFASGGVFSKYSHEFQTLTASGEDIIYVDKKKNIAVNKEVYTDEVLKEVGLDKKNLVEKKAVEVGNIFSLGTKFSEPFDLKYTNEKGKQELVIMGSYGIGLGRLMGTIVEVLSDDKGIIWPESVAPFKVHLLDFRKEQDDQLYQILQKNGIEVIYDDREVNPGNKLKDADLMGMPIRLVLSDKLGDKVELKRRDSEDISLYSEKEVVEILKGNYN
jgi:prolyl-tRNA synthetase